MPQPSASKLSELLESSRPALEAALADAIGELGELDERRQELMSLIGRAQAALGETGPIPTPMRLPDTPGTSASPGPPTGPAERLTLHQAMEAVLKENRNRWMTVRELAQAINSRGLYEKRDRTPVEPGQIHARANKYLSMFEKDGPRVRLKR